MIEKEVQLKSIWVENLFHKYTYNIPVDRDQITIIHGLNGSGKTTLLKMLYYFFSKRYSELKEIPFEILSLDFDDNSTIRIFQNQYYFGKKCFERAENDSKFLGYLDTVPLKIIFGEGKKGEKRDADLLEFAIKNEIKKEIESNLFLEYEQQNSENDIQIFTLTCQDKENKNNQRWQYIEPSLKALSDSKKKKLIKILEKKITIGNRLESDIITDIETDDSKNSSELLDVIFKSMKENHRADLLKFISTAEEEGAKFLTDTVFSDDSTVGGKIYIKIFNNPWFLKYILACKETGIEPASSDFFIGYPSADKNFPFEQILSKIPLHLIGTDRIFEILGRSACEDLQEYRVEDLIKRINDAKERFNEQSRWLEKTYIERLLDRTQEHDIDITTNVLTTKLFFIQFIRELLEKQGFIKHDPDQFLDDRFSFDIWRNYNFTKSTKVILQKQHKLYLTILKFLITNKWFEKGAIDLNENHFDLDFPEQLDNYLSAADVDLPVAVYIDDAIEKYDAFLPVLKDWMILKIAVENFFTDKVLTFSDEDGIFLYDIKTKASRPLKVPLNRLSSGEQHLFAMLYELVFNIPDNSLVLMDEPELSLHISWQIELVRTIKEILESTGKNRIKLLIATHSPHIIDDRWDLTVRIGSQENAEEESL